jgi:RimJ/RimL family protein N-acetyltransferase
MVALQPSVSLVPATEDDLPFLYALASHPAVEPFLAVGAGERDVLRGLLDDALREPGPNGLFLIRSSEGESLGGLRLRVVNQRSRICELSRLMIRPDKRRAGVATAAVMLACRKVLVDHGLHRIQLEVYGDNLPGQALFERIGFVREGTRRRAYWRRNCWQDGVQFGMLAEELNPITTWPPAPQRACP